MEWHGLTQYTLKLLDASNFIETIQSLEETTCIKRYITTKQLLKTAEDLKKTDYGKYLFNLKEKE